MDKLKNYDVSFIGLKNGTHRFNFKINTEFFDLFDFDEEFESPQLNVLLYFEKRDTILDFNFKIKGNVILCCDIIAEPFRYPLSNDFHMIVKFGENDLDEGDDVVIVHHATHTINVAQWIYENFMLSLPTKRVHPKVLSGELKTDELSKLEELQPKEKDQIQNEEEMDPRWNKLKDLL
ncbi:MAG: YceD family protein [Flavobacteriales bacterium]